MIACCQTKQMSLTDQITDFTQYVTRPISELPSYSQDNVKKNCDSAVK